MNRSSPIALAAVLVLGFVACSERDAAESNEEMEVRRYRATDVWLAGGGTPQQEQLYQAYEEAASKAGESTDPRSVPIFRIAFEACGIEFIEGASVTISAADTHLYFRHTSKTLDDIEERFGMERVAFPVVDPDDVTDDDPFATAEQDGAEQPATAPDSESEGKEKVNPESEGRSQ